MRYIWRSLLLVPSTASARELYKYNLSIADVKDVLENGQPCQRSKRAKGTHEICLNRQNKTIRVVVKKTTNAFERSDIWLIVHVGIHSRRS